jgi:hypothetical protein
MTSVFKMKKIHYMRTYVLRVPNLINYIFSMHVQLSNGERKQLSLQQETMPYVNGFPVVCSAVITTQVTS